jgi:hypothetical protein
LKAEHAEVFNPVNGGTSILEHLDAYPANASLAPATSLKTSKRWIGWC